MANPSVHVVVIAGGSGQRFWPRSRRCYPKPLLKVLGGKSLLDTTLERARKITTKKHIWLVCGRDHSAEMRKAAKLPASQVLVEPEGRNTAMAVAWAAQHIVHRDPDAVLAVLPADHHVPNPRAFAAAILRCAKAANDAQVLVTLGVKPTRPDVGYGYIQTGALVGKNFKGLHRVGRFVEKPDGNTARRYVRRGGYLWNAGVFVWRADTILEEIKQCAPDLHRSLAAFRKEKRLTKAKLERAYRRAPSLPIDIAVMERSKRVWTLPVDFHWSDVGNWASLAEELGVETDCSKQVAGDVLMHDSPGNLVWGDARKVVLLGVHGLAVIDTPDALLVADLERSPEVRRIVDALAKGKDRNLL